MSQAAVVPPPPPPLSPPPVAAASAVAADAAPQPNKKTGFWLVDYGGVIGFAMAVSVLGFYLYRQKKGGDRRQALTDNLELSAAVCPGEIKELRAANLVK